MLRLVRTCGACPEQYDVFKGEELVGYMRLRHGVFYALCHKKEVYSACPEGDGIFEPHERDRYLGEACQAVEDCLAGKLVEKPRAPYVIEEMQWK